MPQGSGASVPHGHSGIQVVTLPAASRHSPQGPQGRQCCHRLGGTGGNSPVGSGTLHFCSARLLPGRTGSHGHTPCQGGWKWVYRTEPRHRGGLTIDADCLPLPECPWIDLTGMDLTKWVKRTISSLQTFLFSFLFFVATQHAGS